MDRPVLYSLVERLRAEERLTEFAAAMPAGLSNVAFVLFALKKEPPFWASTL